MGEESYKEDAFEQALMALMRDELGYTTACGYDIERDLNLPYDRSTLVEQLKRINPRIPQDALDEALRKVEHIEAGTLLQNNELFMDYLQNGIDAESVSKQRTVKVRLIDYDHRSRNTFCCYNQWKIEGGFKNVRLDMVVMVNGLPLVVIELKSPSSTSATVDDAFAQIKNYQLNCPQLFDYNVFSIISDFSETLAGTITSKRNRYMAWKTVEGDYESTDLADFKTPFLGMLQQDRLLEIVRDYVCFDKNEGAVGKILAGYHQFFAVRKALSRTHQAVEGDGKIGVFWHTQGSGKSLSMVFFAHKLIQEFPETTIVVVTDRKDLDDQLYGQFGRCSAFLRQQPEKSESREDLICRLKDRKAGGIIFTTIQKFTEGNGALSDRRNIIVMTDEAHRSQYGEEHWDVDSQKVKKGFAKKMREALPNASFVGFTGTPISTRDKDTVEVFGNYIDIYDMTQSVADGATRPVYYESRVLKLHLDKEVLAELDAEFDRLADEGASEEQLREAKHKMSRLEQVLGADETLDSLVKDIVKHYEQNRAQELTGKAMIVAYSREIAIKIYQRILALRPEWKDKVKAVMSGSNKDPEEWHDIIGNEDYKKKLAIEFKKDDSEFKIAIVRDMWLTGFDVPSLATMYVYKAMNGHNLMQAIARVNRVFPGKEGGLIVDYIGIAQALKRAMHDYTARDQKRFGDPDIAKTAKIKWQEEKELCCDQLHGYDYSAFMDGNDLQRANIIKGGVNFLLSVGKEEQRQAFVEHSANLHNATTLCRSLLKKEQKVLVAYFDAVRILLNRLTKKGKLSKQEINERISALIEQSIKGEGVINLFENNKAEFSIFDAKFVEQVARMKEKNLAVEMLKKLLKEQITKSAHVNVVESEKFSELLSEALSQYLKGQLSNEEVIRELLKIAEQLKAAQLQGNELGLTPKEKAFYDALTRPQAVKDFYSNDQLVGIVRELTDMLQRNKTIDWNHKESARAKMRTLVKRLLRKYNYPPEGQEEALETVMRQCDKWADNEDNFATIEEDEENAFDRVEDTHTVSLFHYDDTLPIAAEKPIN